MASSSDNAPLPLSQLRPWISEETYDWIAKADVKDAAFKQLMEDEGANNVAGLFDDEDDEEEAISDRVQRWASSSKNPNGIGGYQNTESTGSNDEDEGGEGAMQVLFVLSDSWEGFGGLLWASARHVANILSDADRCRDMLKPMLQHRKREESSMHPLLGTSFAELGAGAGVPSWAAMRCGARVVCTDLAKENRVRCMAESAERNWREMKAVLPANDPVLMYAGKAKSCPHDWGTPISKVAESLNKDGTERFDVVVAADCLYMPDFHNELLNSVDLLLSDHGVALLPFALHGNTDDESVWNIVELAKEKGFTVETLGSEQLTPSYNGMGSKQGLVHTLRLTKK